MRRKFLAPALVFIMCIGITMTAYASPQADQLQNQPQFTTNATSEELSIIKTLFSAEEYAELYPDVVKTHGNEEAALWDHFVTYGLSEGRALSKSFHVFAYRAAYEDLQEAFGNNLIAYYMNITLRRSRLSGVARATLPDKQSHPVINYCIMF